MSRQKNDGKGRLGGRKAGTPNKATATTREWIQQILDENQQTIRDDLKKLSAKDRVNALLSLIPYIVPKQMAAQATLAVERLTDDEIEAMTTDILNSLEDEDTTD